MSRMRVGAMLGILCLAVVLIWAGCGSDTSQPAQASPQAEDGATLLNTVCSQCHSVSWATDTRETRAQWEQTVSRMMARGAQLTDAEKSVLVDYLAAHYGS